MINNNLSVTTILKYIRDTYTLVLLHNVGLVNHIRRMQLLFGPRRTTGGYSHFRTTGEGV